MKQASLRNNIFWYRVCVISFATVILGFLLLTIAFSGKQNDDAGTRPEQPTQGNAVHSTEIPNTPNLLII
jgi:hypothetical protein